MGGSAMEMTAGHIMTRGVKTVTSDMTVGEATQAIKDHGKRHLVVVDAKTRKMTGLISDRDIKKFVSPFIGTARETDQDKATLQIRLDKVMHRQVYAVTPEEPLKTVVQKMLEKKVGSTVVLDVDGVPVGIITRTDILKTILNYL
jgi:acetoin utilization protein AcuB